MRRHIPPSKAKKCLKGMDVIGSVKLPEKDKPPVVKVSPIVAMAADRIRYRSYAAIMKEIL